MQKKVIKTDLGLVQDGESNAKELLELARDLKAYKKDVQRTIARIDGIEQDGKERLRYVKNVIQQIQSINRQMGIKTDIPQFKQFEKSIADFESAQKLKI